MKIDQPDYFPPADFTTADEAVDRLKQIYDLSISFLKNAFSDITTSMKGGIKYRAFYPEISIKIDRFAQIDSRLSFGHLTQPGHYATTITRPDLFENYLKQQIGLLIRNHNVPVTIGVSETPIPLHFAIPQGLDGNITQDRVSQISLRDVFDVPELSNMNDNIVDGLYDNHGGMPLPLARRSAWIILWRVWPITQPPSQSIFKTMFYSPTISFTYLRLKFTPANNWRELIVVTQALSLRGIMKLRRLTLS